VVALISIFAGTMFGVFTVALMQASRRDDD
jgi:hypothetical protein